MRATHWRIWRALCSQCKGEVIFGKEHIKGILSDLFMTPCKVCGGIRRADILVEAPEGCLAIWDEEVL